MRDRTGRGPFITAAHASLPAAAALGALAPAVLLGLFGAAWPRAASAEWTLEGDLGLELESVSESFAVPDTIPIDVSSTPDDDVFESFETVRFRDRDTLTDGLLRLRLSHTGPAWNLDVRSRVAAGSGRTRETVEVEAGHRTEGGSRLRFFDYFYGQSGGSESSDGFQNEIDVSWEPAWFGERWDVRWRGRWDLSQSSDDSTSTIFNYNRARTGLRVRRTWGWGREIGVETQWASKWMQEGATGDYESGEVRFDFDWEFDLRTPLSVSYALERRNYTGERTLTDSYWEHDAQLRFTHDFTDRWGFESRAAFRSVDYDSTGSIFFDNRILSGQILARRRLGSSWTVKLGPGGGWLDAPSDAAFGSYRTGHGQLELAFEPIGRLWFHATGRVGRRDYQGEGESQVVSFEGYNLGLTTSDYTFTSLSFLGAAEVTWGIAVEFFLQYDDERHDRPEDDFSLTLLTLRVSRSL